MTSILNYFPKGKTPREGQRTSLLQIEKHWDSVDVFAVDMDTGGGKSDLLQTIAEWRAAKGESSATLTPKVSLQDQYKKSFPEVVVLRGKSRYKCKDSMFKNCLEAKEVTGEYCPGCQYSCDRTAATEAKNGVFSIHSYLMLRARKDNLLIDESHSLYSIMSDQNTVKLWQHKVNYPDGMKDYADVIIWLEKAINLYEEELNTIRSQISELRSHSATKVQLLPWVTGEKEIEQTLNRYARVLKGIRFRPTDYFIEHVKEEYRGKPAKALQIRPTTLEDCMGWLWPRQTTNKVILASGTLSELDLKKLGLSNLRVKWIHAPQAISTECKPIVLEFAGNMSYKYQDKAIPKMAEKILELQQRHSNTKGMIHATYGIADKLRKHLGNKPNIIWHTQKDKEEKLQEFMKAPPGTVFIASGMYEGVDLSGPDFGYQALAKVSWPSKADKLISHWYDQDFDWISWMACRDIRQACGRVNRYDGDYAITYLLDNCFGNPNKNRRGFLTQFKKLLGDEFLSRIKEEV